MKDTGLIKKGKRQLKNEENRRRLLDAMESIMEQYDYNTVTIRNICQVSGVSYGSFYNLYESKEVFLREYLTEDFTRYLTDYYKEHGEFDDLSNVDKSIDVFVCCARYNVIKGIRFIRGFYTPNNDSLFPDLDATDEKYSFTPLLQMAEEYLKKAKAEGTLSDQADIMKITHTYCYIFNGVTFNWCLSNGKVDMVGETERLFKEYIRQFLP
ncbi:MAG: TetR/AcrR family transcriptional regulator [Eubacterium sp.]|nr:TetR/AcrR family transcriptional regulator [Eubacterium sp.]